MSIIVWYIRMCVRVWTILFHASLSLRPKQMYYFCIHCSGFSYKRTENVLVDCLRDNCFAKSLATAFYATISYTYTPLSAYFRNERSEKKTLWQIKNSFHSLSPSRNHNHIHMGYCLSVCVCRKIERVQTAKQFMRLHWQFKRITLNCFMLFYLAATSCVSN